MDDLSKQEREQQMFRLIEQCHSCDMTKKEFRKEHIIPDHKTNRLQDCCLQTGKHCLKISNNIFSKISKV